MYQQETITKELHLQLSDEDLAQFELDAKETDASDTSAPTWIAIWKLPAIKNM